jgi:hypothetical protein
MIQRMQTVYLLVVIILISLFYFLPFASFVIDQDMSIFHLSIEGLIPDAGGQKPLLRVIPLIFLLSTIIVLSFTTILLFKRRMHQIRLCVIIIGLLVGLQGLLYYYASVSAHQLGCKASYSLVFIAPVIAVILTYLAIRRIAKDEALVRSSDRLR